MIRLKNHFIRKAGAEYVITILIISVVLSGTNSSIQKSYAQTGIGTIAGCLQLPIASVTASGNDGNLPANVLDNNLNTRWSNLSVGSFVQADLGGQKTICSVDVAWYRGNLRVNNFVISVSNDGTTFTNVFTGKSSGTTLSAEKYSLPTSVTARYVRITVNGNTLNNWASITELSVDGFSSTNTNCTKLPIATATASGNDGNLPANVLDSNLNTRWSNLGIGSWIQADLGSKMNICNVNIAWYNGNTRQNNFVISVSNDGTTFTNVFTGKSSGTTLSPETYLLPGGTTGRYVRITVNGNTLNNWASITELSVDGTPQNNPPPLPPTANNINIQTNTGTPVTVTLTGTDPIQGDTLKFFVVANPVHGTLTNPTANTVTYAPNTGFSGTDTFTYKANDGQGVSSNIATVTITVNAPPPPPPAADNKMIQTNKETPIGITLTGTDPIPSDVLRFSVVGNPQHGSVTPGTVSSNVFYTPNTGFIGTDSFTYKATDGQGVDSNIATVSIIISNATSGGNNLDPFGIREIYPTTPSGEQWFMNMNDPNNDPRTEPQTTLTKNPDGSWKITSNAVRFNVFTSSGYHHELITTLNQQQLATKGYMQSPNDWKNIEMTGYVKFNTGDTSDGFTWYARGGHHTGAGFPQGCEGTSIKEELDFAGTTRFEKEQWHVHYVFTPHKPATDPIQGKWVGYKAVMYNVDQNGITAVKEEIWLDPNDNGNWVKVNEFTDAGGFGDQGQVCGGKPDQIITWGGPITTFRWDKTTDVDIKDFSVREIQSPH